MNKYLFQQKMLLALTVFTLLLTQTAEIGVAFYLQYVMDQIVQGNISNMGKILAITVIYLLGMLGVACLSKCLREIYIGNVMQHMQSDLYAGLLKMDVSDFHKENTGYYLSMFQNDLNMIETDKVQNILRIITNIYCFLVASLAMICMNPIIAAVSLAFAVIPLFFPKLFIRKAQINKEAYLEVMSDSSIQTKEYLNGFDIIKIYGVKDVFLNFFSEKKREVARARCQMESFNRLTESVMANLAVWMQLAVYLTAGYLALIGKVSVGVMIGTLQLCAYTVQPVRELMQSYSSLKSVKKVEDHLMSFIKNSEETESVETDVNGVPPIIEFKTVYFSYPNEIQYALKNVTFRLEKGNKYAILGESGSGKSTIVKLVMGYYRQWQGEIYLGEKKLQEWNSTDIGKMLSVVEQNVFLFEDSIKNNITLYKEYNQEQLEQVIKQSGLENVLKDLPQGIDTIVKENGQNFSGGEAQRIAVARALFYDAPILIYDEAAANLDNMTANLFEEMVLNQTGKTVLFITHRINERLLQRYDGIMLFKNGCLVGFDTYWNLISGNRYFCELINKIDVS